MKNVSKISIFIIMFFIIISLTNTIFAANLNLYVDFDGEKIEMTSETPEMLWSLDNVLPGETYELILNISNTGKKDIDVSYAAKIENGEELAEALNIKIIKLANETQKEDEVFFDGNYTGLMKLGLFLEAGKSQEYKIITHIPEELGNEFQNRDCTVKFSFIASGYEDDVEISTDKVEQVQTGETRTIYKVVAFVVVAFVILLVTFFVGKKKEKED